VRQAVVARSEALRRLGIGPDDPDRVAKLRELERRELGAEIAARSGMTFLARVPEGFRGCIQPAERAGPPGAYAVVSDGERFVVLRSTPRCAPCRVTPLRSRVTPRDGSSSVPIPTTTSAAERDPLPLRWALAIGRIVVSSVSPRLLHGSALVSARSRGPRLSRLEMWPPGGARLLLCRPGRRGPR
jgi:hypothetical protein